MNLLAYWENGIEAKATASAKYAFLCTLGYKGLARCRIFKLEIWDNLIFLTSGFPKSILWGKESQYYCLDLFVFKESSI